MNEWTVGSNGNWFKDMGDGRYCVAILQNGQNEILRNGVRIRRPLTSSIESAKHFAETYAAATA